MFEVTAELPMLELILHLRGHADAHRLEFRVVDVGGNDHPAAGDFIANQFGSKLLALRDVVPSLR